MMATTSCPSEGPAGRSRITFTTPGCRPTGTRGDLSFLIYGFNVSEEDANRAYEDLHMNEPRTINQYLVALKASREVGL